VFGCHSEARVNLWTFSLIQTHFEGQGVDQETRLRCVCPILSFFLGQHISDVYILGGNEQRVTQHARTMFVLVEIKITDTIIVVISIVKMKSIAH
jgi:hypothetical protein